MDMRKLGDPTSRMRSGRTAEGRSRKKSEKWPGSSFGGQRIAGPPETSIRKAAASTLSAAVTRELAWHHTQPPLWPPRLPPQLPHHE
jgi:hypothetical protein